MVVNRYCLDDLQAVFRLWNDSGVRQGFATLELEAFVKLVAGHPYFSREHAFVLKDEENVLGFICGCVGEDLPKGEERGYFTCLLLAKEVESEEYGVTLIEALEKSFRQAGKKYAACTFFNPMRLPWVISDKGHQHNNAPGIAVDLPLYKWMKKWGYEEAAQECAMYLDMEEFVIPDWVEAKKEKAARRGYQVEWYDSKRHRGLVSMVDSMENTLWSAEIPEAALKINMIVAVKDNKVVGFTGPVFPEKTGRGYFAGIAVSAKHERQGLGTLLFYELCRAEKEAGAKYMSLFTGSDNHAQKIYQNAGFSVKRIFSVMIKNL